MASLEFFLEERGGGWERRKKPDETGGTKINHGYYSTNSDIRSRDKNLGGSIDDLPCWRSAPSLALLAGFPVICSENGFFFLDRFP
mgnify:CR=1 FL=1